MKKYKVGDTIYIKTTVTEVDLDDPALTYRGFDNEWIDTDTIVDELPTAEPTKPELPKGVADEMEKAKRSHLSFYGYLQRTAGGFAFCSSASSDEQIKILPDAWYNGYTIKDKLYNIILGKNIIEVTPVSTDTDITGLYRDWETDRKSTRLNSSHSAKSRMPSSA